jgi:hypothetical protein
MSPVVAAALASAPAAIASCAKIETGFAQTRCDNEKVKRRERSGRLIATALLHAC